MAATYNSDYSAEVSLDLSAISAVGKVSFSKTDLAAGRISWDKTDLATNYSVSIDGSVVSSDSTDLYYDASKLTSGDHTISVIAYNSANRTYDSSSTTGSLSLSVISAPTNFSYSQASINSVTLSWTAPTYATQYDIYDGTSLVASDVTGTSKTLSSLAPGSHTVSIIAKFRTPSNEAYEKTYDSVKSEISYSLNKIPNPKASVSTSADKLGEVVLSWTESGDSILTSDIKGYALYVDDTLSYTAESTASAHTFTGISSGSDHKFGVKALSSTDSAYDSDISSVSTSLSALATPVPSWSASSSNPAAGTVSWTAITGADHYIVYVNGSAQTAVSGTSDSVTTLTLGSNNIGVLAYNASNRTYDSQQGTISVTTSAISPVSSNTISFTRSETVANAGTLKWTGNAFANSYDIYLGSTKIGNTASTSYSLSSISLGNSVYGIVAKNTNASGYDSSKTTYTVTTSALSAPSPSWTASSSVPDQGTVSWNAVTYATGYQVSLDGSAYAPQTSLSKSITGLTVGAHTISVIALFSGDSSYNSKSGSVSISTARLSNPTNLNFSYSDALKTGTMTWAKAASGYTPSNYDIYLNGAKQTSVSNSTFSYTFTNLLAGSNTVGVVASYSGNASYNSDLVTNAIESPKLPSPVLSWTKSATVPSDGTVSWSAIQNATNYIVYVDSTEKATITETSYSVAGLSIGTHTIGVKAYNSSDRTYDSSISSISVTTTRLSSVTGLAFSRSSSVINAGTLSWSSVPYANSYDVYKGTTLLGNVTATSYSLTDISQGTTAYGVVAKNSSATSYDSEKSEINVTVNVLATPAPVWTASDSVNRTGYITWPAISYADSYDVSVDGTSLGTTTSLKKTIPAMSVGYHTISVRALSAYGASYSSASGSINVTSVILKAPTNLTWAISSSVPDGGTFSWSSAADADSYCVYVDGTIQASSPQTGTSISLSSLSIGSHTLSVVSSMSADRSYNSIKADLVITLVALAAPTISFSDSKDASSGKITAMNVVWGTVAKSTGYIVYDSYTDQTDATSQSYYIISGQLTNSYKITEDLAGVGTHSITVRSTYTNSDYDSPVSISKSFAVDTLTNPVISWTTSGKSYIDVSAQTNADTYIASITSSSGKEYQSAELAISNIKGFDVHSIISANGLSQIIDSYTVNVYSRSNSEFYHRSNASKMSNLTYAIKRLDPPSNITFNADTEDLSWSVAANAVGYVLYDQTKSGTVVRYPSTGYMTATTYDFENLSGLHYYHLNSIADSATDLNPEYLDSNDSDVVVGGGLLTPVISRNNKTLSWGAIDNAISYIIYDTFYDLGASPVATVIASGLSTESFDLSSNAKTNSIGSHSITVVASGSDDEFALKSKASNSVAYTINQIDSPSFAFTSGTSILTWNDLSSQGATSYQIYNVNGNFVDEVTDLTYTFKYSATETGNNIISSTGDYYFYVKAISTDSFLHRSSAYSGSGVLYRIQKLATPSLSFAYNSEKTGGAVSWTAISNANAYNIRVNFNGTDQDPYDTTNTSVAFTDVQSGSYGVYVYAKDSTQTDTSNPKYLNSESGSTGFGKLAAPVITRSQVTFTWAAIANATSYSIYNGSTFMDEIRPASSSDTSIVYSLRNYVKGSYSISVVAHSASSTLLDSDSSNSLLLTIQKLDAPVITVGEDNVVKWNKILNATRYEVFLGSSDKSVINTPTIKSTNDHWTYYWKPLIYGGYATGTSYDVSPWYSEGSKLKVYVIAENENAEFINSDRSNTVSKFVSVDASYKAIIANSSVPFDIQLPFTITQTLDETLDRGEVTLVPNNIKEPFEPYTDITISVNVANSSEPLKQYDMIVDHDSVEEVQTGASCLYEHHITMIERTKLLETIIMPDITVSQPEAYSAVGYTSNVVSKIEPYCGDNKVWTNQTILGWSDEYHNDDFKHLYTCSLAGLTRSMPKKMVPGTTFFLPNDASEFAFKYYQYVKTAFKETISNNGNEKPTRHWWIKATDDAYQSKEIDNSYKEAKYSETPSTSNGWTEIGSASDNDMYIQAQFPSDGKKYDLAFTIDSVRPSLNMDRFIPRGNGPAEPKSYQPYMMSGMISSDFSIYYLYPKTPVYLENIQKMVPYKYMYFGIESASISKGDYLNPYNAVYMTSKDSTKFSALSHILNCVAPVISGKSPKYTIDPAIVDDLSTVICPELTYEHGKNLFEILLDVGRLFLGIPRLLKNNVITFDILTKSTGSSTELPESNEKEFTESDISNHTTGFVSGLSNVIPSNSWDRYPVGDTFVYPRSSNANDPYITRDNMAIVLPKNIYKIIDVQVKTSDQATPISIKNYVFEKTVYDTLQYFTTDDNSNNGLIGKDRALYWKKGDNRIYGLGIIPDASKTYSALGWKDTDYTINHILGTSASDASAKASLNYKYAVWYIPYGDMQTYVEQTNISGLKNSTYLNLNQENNTINDESFGQSAQTQVDRLGNNSISKTFRTKFFIDLPNVGNYHIFNENKYYIDSLTIKFCNSYYEVGEVYSKNWNKINERVGLNSEYRQYNIESKNYVFRDLCFNDYCYLSTQKYSDPNPESGFINNRIISDITGAFNQSPVHKKTQFYITCSTNSGKLSYTENLLKDGVASTKTRFVLGLSLPVTYYTYKNSIQYSGTMIDNYSAGLYGVNTRYDSAYGGVNNVIQQDARYTDNAGNCPYMSVTLCDYDKAQMTLNDSEIENFGFTNKTRATDPASALPLCSHWQTPTNLTGCVMSRSIHVDKDMREALRFSYQLHFITFDKDITIHSGITRNLYYNDFDYAGGFYSPYNKPVYIGFNEDIRWKETLPSTYGDILGTPTVTQDGRYIKISTISVRKSKTYTGYALVWPSNYGTDPSIIYDVKKPLTPDANGNLVIPDIWMNFYNSKIDPKDN